MENNERDERPAARPLKPTPEQERREKIEEDLRETLENLESQERKTKSFLWVGIPLAVIGLFIGALSFGWFEPSETTNRFDARMSCENAVEEQLLAPTTAKVTTFTSAQGTNNPRNWKFTGEVTAENGFGARITSDWVCYFENEVPRALID